MQMGFCAARAECLASRGVGAQGDGTQHHHSDRCAAEHEAEPGEDGVRRLMALLVHAEAEHREECADEHHHEGDDLVCTFLRIAGRSGQHQ